VPNGAYTRSPPISAPRSAWPGLGAIDLKAAAHGSGDRLEIILVRAHYQVVPAHGSLNDTSINDVGGCGASGEGADGASLAIVEGLDIAPGQQPG